VRKVCGDTMLATQYAVKSMEPETVFFRVAGDIAGEKRVDHSCGSSDHWDDEDGSKVGSFG